MRREEERLDIPTVRLLSAAAAMIGAFAGEIRAISSRTLLNASELAEKPLQVAIVGASDAAATDCRQHVVSDLEVYR